MSFLGNRMNSEALKLTVITKFQNLGEMLCYCLTCCLGESSSGPGVNLYLQAYFQNEYLYFYVCG